MFTTLILLALLPSTLSQSLPASSLASLYSLPTSTSLPFPTTTLASPDSQSFIQSLWGLNHGRIQNGPTDLAFVPDPFPSSPVPGSLSTPTGPVLQVTYPSGSFSHDTGGAQFYEQWNNTYVPPTSTTSTKSSKSTSTAPSSPTTTGNADNNSTFLSMMVSYEVAFDEGFNWVKGGKLPGLRGGPNPDGCSGGAAVGDGSDCFSTRLMWRDGGAGEVYAYIPTSNDICGASNIICNSDFGTSISRGSFSFASGQWNRITMLVQLNNPANVANGFVTLYYNDVHALSQTGLQIRADQVVTAGGFYFSDSSYATPQTTHTYFRNFNLWASTAPSNLTGTKVSNSNGGASLVRGGSGWVLIVAGVVGVALGLLL
ncbi:polysaccharide lyase family 14 protein [Jaapia argillacea MUCL 33604]|uniref:Polysaccharide lyase family 14 protein n=1 Tax=Jaapia argillacea MUCL 33604 TaxID=933084 RepID=A0A067PF20_9AGAM|nr:polysaccharide lyase family 14 protein [Jaapia argillacea MUCL 33604]